MVNFYTRFIPCVAHLMHPCMRCKHVRGLEASEDLGSVAAPGAVTTETSDFAVEVVYERWVDGVWQPLAFFSRRLRENDTAQYSTFNQELLYFSLPRVTSGSCWRAISSLLWTTSPLHLKWPIVRSHGEHGSSMTFLSSRNVRQTFVHLGVDCHGH